jgi:hypothetical protein
VNTATTSPKTDERYHCQQIHEGSDFRLASGSSRFCDAEHHRNSDLLKRSVVFAGGAEWHRNPGRWHLSPYPDQVGTARKRLQLLWQLALKTSLHHEFCKKED